MMAQAMELARDGAQAQGGSRAGGIGRQGWLKRTLLGAGAVLAVAGAAQFGTQYWRVGRFMVETDDAYVQADSTLIGPRISGTITEVLVRDNQQVKPGDVLARIDDRDFRVALNQAIADRSAAQTEIGSIDAQLVLQESTIDEADGQVEAAQAALTFARQDQARYGELARTGAGSTQQAQQTQSLLLQRNAALRQARAALNGARQRVEVLKAARAKAEAQLLRAVAVEDQARLNLSYTTISAPIGGTVGARALRVGQYVQAGTQLMAVVPLDQVYVVANYKETQLTDVHPGQPVELSVDTYPGVVVSGHVDSIAPATGLQFALLPPDNATGNFTKIVQRVPVRIVLDGAEVARGILRPGMSVAPAIDTRPDAGQVAASPRGAVL
jgi:membrane fusion protein, multidrug efflux system